MRIILSWLWNNFHFIKITRKMIYISFKGGNRRPAPPYKPSLPSLDSSFHRDKNLSTTENSQYDLKPESETPQESSTIKKDASHQETLIEDGAKNHTNNSNKDQVKSTTDVSVVQNATKKPEHEESTKKHHTIHKYHTNTLKENKINSEETLILGLATDVIPTTRHPESSVTSNDQTEVTKSSKSEEKVPATSKGEKLIEKTTSTTSKAFSTSTLNIETSSSVQVIETTSTKIILRPSATTTTTIKSSVDTKLGVSLEPSSTLDVEYIESTSSISTPTDGLPTTYSKSSVTTEKNIIHPTTSIFTKNTGT